MKKNILNIAVIIGIILFVWIAISTVQAGSRLPISEWNFWELLLKLAKWRMAL